jgi:3-methyladenine DNA glycosylase/8-oxoguanine DNA glycosylase
VPEPADSSAEQPGGDGALVPADELAEVRPLPVLAEARPVELDRPRPVSVPAAVVAATGGFVLGVATFLLVRGHALVPGRHPPARPPLSGAAAASSRQAVPPRRTVGSLPAVVERDVVPLGAYRLPGRGRDGVLRLQDGVLVRLLHTEGEEAVVRAWATRAGVRLRSEGRSRGAAFAGVERMRFALGVHQDLAPFHDRFRRDTLIGPVIRRRPWLRPRRRPEPFEALAWAICEQLIDAERAVGIQRRLIARYGFQSECGNLRDVPAAAVLARRSPAEMEACGLSAGRALTLVRAAREVATGRADLAEHEPAWDRLRAIPGVGSWTLEKLALHGQGRDDQLPAGDLAYLKLVGRLERLGRRATEEEVRAFFSRYEPFAGLAGIYLLSGAYSGFIGP